MLRNYSLGTKLESRMTYEMRLHLPQTPIVEKHDTIVYTQTVVDTVTVAPLRRIAQLHAFTLLTASMHTDGPSWGIMAAIMRRHGVYLHASSNLHSAKPALGSCKPYYTGRTNTSAYAFTLGAIHRLNGWLNIFEGVGYASQTTSWQLADSEGGGWLRNDDLTHKGVAAEIGVVVNVGRLSFSASALTIAGKQWQGGVGICLGKNGVTIKRKQSH